MRPTFCNVFTCVCKTWKCHAGQTPGHDTYKNDIHIKMISASTIT